MEKELMKSGEMEVKLMVAEGKLMVVAEHEGKLGSAKMELALKLESVIDAIEAAIPGEWDKIPAAMLKEALKKI